jgi:hypothetical protein
MRRHRLEYPAFFYTALFAFVGDTLNTIQEKKWPDFRYSHPTPAIRANFGDWRGPRAYPEICHDVCVLRPEMFRRVFAADAQTGPTIKGFWGPDALRWRSGRAHHTSIVGD